MTAATVTIDETNGAGPTGSESANISNTNMGSVDAANLVAADYPVTAGTNSYEKYQRFHLTNLGTSNRIQNLKVWRTTALSGSDAHKTNAREASYAQKTYATPVATTSTQATQTMPTSVPTGANLGIGGSLSGNLSAPGYSDYLVHQLQVDSSTTAGATCTLNYQYDEVA